MEVSLFKDIVDFIEKKIGIWGYGIVGKSLIKYLLGSKNKSLSVLEKREFTKEEIHFFDSNKVRMYNQNSELENFLNENDIIIPSPGINLDPFKNFTNKFLSEIDLFYLSFKKPIIAVTGTLGKTSVTHLLSKIFQVNNNIMVGAGNIGLGMCELIENQSEIQGVILEVSSFQLEYCKIFSPNLAIWTNFYPNHLDRHINMEKYFESKSKIFINQDSKKVSLLPISIANKINKNFMGNLNYFCLNLPPSNELNVINYNNIFFLHENYIVKIDSNNVIEKIMDINLLPNISYIENWIIVYAVLYLYGMNIDLGKVNVALPEHRLEKFLTLNSIAFYNDSKSTIPDSTLAAISKLYGKPIILFLGGLNKGIDRSNLILNLKNKVRVVICFGSEAGNLKDLCNLNGIESYEFANLKDAVSFCFDIMQFNDQILFSPSGSSFDLFSNYEERGKVFKNLVNDKVKNMK